MTPEQALTNLLKEKFPDGKLGLSYFETTYTDYRVWLVIEEAFKLGQQFPVKE